MAISLEKARALRDAGLQWEPKPGDCYFDGTEIEVIPFPDIEDDYEYVIAIMDSHAWLPRLDQLLAEIEKRGYYPALYCFGNGKYEIEFTTGLYFRGDTPEDAAADALLWILREGMAL